MSVVGELVRGAPQGNGDREHAHQGGVQENGNGNGDEIGGGFDPLTSAPAPIPADQRKETGVDFVPEEAEED